MRQARTAAIVAALLLVLPAPPAAAYEKDAHYVLTYYLARRCGFSIGQSQRIASADVSIDLESSTEPFQIGKVIVPWNTAQPIRIKFHAFPDSSRKEFPFIVTEGDEAAAQKHRAKRLEELWQEGMNAGNPGVYLHFMQDTYAHDGYWSRAGHTTAGNAQDFIAQDPQAARRMVDDTIQKLGKFMRDFLKREPCVPDAAEVEDVLARLIRANPTPSIPANYDPGVLGIGEPDWKAAKDIVDGVLHETSPGWNQYHFDESGDPTGDMKVPPATSAEFLQGAWHDKDEEDPSKFVHIRYKPKENAPDEFEFEGAHEWFHGTYDEKTEEVTFARKPAVEEMGSDVPKWARPMVKDKLEWHLVLKVEPCALRGKFYPGLVKWKQDPDGTNREASVPEGKDGWGEGRDVEYDWAGTR